MRAKPLLREDVIAKGDAILRGIMPVESKTFYCVWCRKARPAAMLRLHNKRPRCIACITAAEAAAASRTPAKR